MLIRHLIQLTAILVASLASNLEAAPYEPAVYITELTDESRARSMEAWIWGPSNRLVARRLRPEIRYSSRLVDTSAENSCRENIPMLIFFHGTSGNTRSIAWLSSALAMNGYIVVSANHPGSTSLQVSQDSIMATWAQAEDGRFLIDTILTSDTFAPYVDADRIGSIGFSLGGYSALAIAGVRIEIQELQRFCRTRPTRKPANFFLTRFWSAGSR